MRVKTEEEIYKSADRPRSNLKIFGLVVDRNRVDVVVESGLLHFSPPRRDVGRRAETNLLGNKAGRGRFQQDGREKQTDLFVILTGGRRFAAGGRVRLEGLPLCGGKAEDTFFLEKIGFNLSTEILSCLEPICILKYLSFLSATLYGSMIQLRERRNRRIFMHKYKIQA